MQRPARQLLLVLEPVILALLVYMFLVPVIGRIWGLILLVPLVALHLMAHKRLVAHTPMNGVLSALLGVGILNVFVAPYHDPSATQPYEPLGVAAAISYIWLDVSPLIMGTAVFFVVVEQVRLGRRDGILAGIVTFSIVLGVLALVATEWNSKSTALMFIISRLPVLPPLAFLPGTFNANEMAGGLAWLIPLCAALALFRWRWRFIQVGAGVAFALLMVVLFLGQSRLTIIGVVIALVGVIVLLIPKGRRRYVALAGLAAFILLEAAVALNVFVTDEQAITLVARDERSVGRRFDMWVAALNIVRDYPLTGVGMNMYHTRAVRSHYPVPTYEDRVLPHAHNEFLQLGTDFGVPGWILYVALYTLTARMLWLTWRRGDRAARVIAVGVAAGLLAHGIFGVGDNVALSDRLIINLWWLLGLGAGQYLLVHLNEFSAEKRRGRETEALS